MPVPIIGGAAGFLPRDVPSVTIYCAGCDRTFVASSREGVERLFDEHLAEVRDPGAHEAVPF
jgi:hypothetical protein